MENERLTIGALAKAVNIPTTTVRFYERSGLLAADSRSRGNYRQYGKGSVDRLRFIRSAQASGFTLGDIRALLEFKDGAVTPCREVQELIEERLARVAEQVERLRHMEVVLANWLEACRRAQRSGKCRVIEGLESGRESARNSGLKKVKTRA